MIHCYSWPTPNGIKIHTMLEETGVEYEIHGIDITKGDQFKPSFLKFSPNNKMPAIIDTDGPGGKPISVFESGAILMYLAEKTGKFMPKSPRQRIEVIQWLMFQMGGVGPIFGQVHHFRRIAPGKAPYAEERFNKEAERLYGVLNARLEGRDYLMDSYSIADIATWPWVSRYDWQGIDLARFPNVKRWHDAIAARPAVIKGLAILEAK